MLRKTNWDSLTCSRKTNKGSSHNQGKVKQRSSTREEMSYLTKEEKIFLLKKKTTQTLKPHILAGHVNS